MPCPLSSRIELQKCQQLRRANTLECRGCTEIPTRYIKVGLPADVYEVIKADAEGHEQDVEEWIVGLLKLVATGEYALTRRA